MTALALALAEWADSLRPAPGDLELADRSLRDTVAVALAASGHPVIRSFEPGESWFWSYAENRMYGRGPDLAPPEHHPLDQPVPGPAGRVPRDWQSHLH